MLAVPATIVDRQTLLETLRRQVQQLEKPPAQHHAVFSSGCEAFDRLLPQQGWQQGMLVEWFTAQPGAGAFTLALALCGAGCQPAGTKPAPQCSLVVISDPARQFYAPAAAAFGVSPAQIVVLHPPSAAEELWAIDQSLRCEGVALVWASLPRLDDHDFRRLQLAAESGGTLGFLGRPAKARGQPAWSDLQLLVEPQAAERNRRLRVEVVRIRGGVAGAWVMLEIDDITGEVRQASEHHETHPMPQVPGLASAATRRKQA